MMLLWVVRRAAFNEARSPEVFSFGVHHHVPYRAHVVVDARDVVRALPELCGERAVLVVYVLLVLELVHERRPGLHVERKGLCMGSERWFIVFENIVNRYNLNMFGCIAIGIAVHPRISILTISLLLHPQ